MDNYNPKTKHGFLGTATADLKVMFFKSEEETLNHVLLPPLICTWRCSRRRTVPCGPGGRRPGGRPRAYWPSRGWSGSGAATNRPDTDPTASSAPDLAKRNQNLVLRDLFYSLASSFQLNYVLRQNRKHISVFMTFVQVLCYQNKI